MLKIKLIVVLGLLAFCPIFSFAQEQTKSKIPDGEAKFTSAQLKEYYLVYQNADVKYLRKIFNSYLSSLSQKNQRRIEDSEFAILRKWDKKYFQSKFIVLSRDEGVMGQIFITIAFPEQPDKVFVAAVYKKSGSEFRLDGCDLGKFNDEDIKRLQIRYRVFYKDKVHSM